MSVDHQFAVPHGIDQPLRPQAKVRTRDDRMLAYAEYGSASGEPVLYCHGFPASRLEGQLMDSAARTVGVRLVTIDRPGCGLSTPWPERTLTDWTDDVCTVTKALGIEHFHMLGVSGGGPYALACAARLQNRLGRVGVVCGLGTLVAPGSSAGMGMSARGFIALARSQPVLAAWVYSHLIGRVMRRMPGLVVRILSSAAPPIDHETLALPDVKHHVRRSVAEAFRQGGAGPARDLILYTHPWDFDPAAIRMTVDLWHGERDRTVPVAMGHRLASLIPHCEARFLSEEGHFSLPFRRAEEILAALVST